MENNALKDEHEPQEIFEPFVCCVCLDLLYKPIVLSCGHISCFWCVHKSMSGLRESRCPICRHPYYHFPTICQMLHFLLLKIYPDAYKRRVKQMLEEEAAMGYFSPQIDSYTCGSQAVFDHPGSSPSCTIKNLVSESCSIKSSECMEHSGSATHKGDEDTTIYSEHTSYQTPEVIQTFPDERKKLHNEYNQKQEISIAEVACTMCKQLLFRPVVLNCGHVYCKSCITNSTEDMLRCQECQSPHPKGLPKVCLALDNFLEMQFPEEYAQRRDAIQLSQIKVQFETTSGSLPNGKEENWWPDPRLKVHIEAGCDFCGMYPITGDRYRCLDCKEKIGFDLCGDCYKTRSKLPGQLPGRFNQQHTLEHRLELVQYHRGQFSEQESPENFVIIAEDPALADEGEEEEQNHSEAAN